MFEIYKFVRVFKKVGGSNSVCFLFRISIFCSRFSKFVPIVSKIVSCFQKNTRISKRKRKLINCMCFLISLSNVELRCFSFVIYTLPLPMFQSARLAAMLRILQQHSGSNPGSHTFSFRSFCA